MLTTCQVFHVKRTTFTVRATSPSRYGKVAKKKPLMVRDTVTIIHVKLLTTVKHEE
jgi:hypothetical protein